jgi:peptidyl-prolyl cis-trans isomerase SurA
MMSRFFAFLMFMAVALPAHAQSIAVIVNGQAITDYDVSQRQKLLALGKGGSRQAAVEELVDEQLKLQEAKKLKVEVSDQQVNAAFAQIAQRSKLPPEGFTHALASRGVDAKTLTDRLRAEIAWQSVVRAKARSAMNVREEDVIDALKKKGKDPDTIKSYEYSVMQAMVFVPKGSSPAVAADHRRKAEAFRASVKGCDTAKQKAQAFTDAAVRDPVRRSGTDISTALADLFEKTPVGGTTPIQASDNGFEFMVLCEKKQISGGDGAKAQMRNELMLKEVSSASERILRELRQKANIDYRKK